MRQSKLAIALLATAVLSATLVAAEPATDLKDVGAAFDRLKQLTGDWQIASPADEASKGKVAVRYRVIAGGSAVMETIFPDQPMEMVTVYHRDGEQLVMTHYCCAGNQPRMRGKIGERKDELVFEFAGGSNLNPAKDGHIHEGKIRFVDADHLHSEWAYFADGKEAGRHSFDLVRKK